MARRIRFHGDFKADLKAQLKWLETNRDEGWIQRLHQALDDATQLLARFPSVGTIERREGHTVLRRLILRDAPYVLLFISEAKPQIQTSGFCASFMRDRIAP